MSKSARRIGGLQLQSFEELTLLEEKSIRLHEMFMLIVVVFFVRWRRSKKRRDEEEEEDSEEKLNIPEYYNDKFFSIRKIFITSNNTKLFNRSLSLKLHG